MAAKSKKTSTETKGKARRRGLFEEWQQPEKLIILEGWRRDGLTFEEIAHNIGIRRETLFKWSKRSEHIGNALKNGSEVMVFKTENELYESSKNRYVEELEVVETAIYDKNTGEEVWKFQVSGYTWCSPLAIYDGSGKAYIVVCNSNGDVYVLDGKGNKLDSINLESNIEASPVAFGNYIVIGTRIKGIFGLKIY